jgi:hypothetical protein
VGKKFFFKCLAEEVWLQMLPVLNQINFPFKKKSKQLQLRGTNCMALLLSTFEMKANTAIVVQAD